MSDNTQRPANPISRFLSDEQDPATTEQVFNRVSQLLTQGEEIAYIAVQKPIVALTPDSVVLTNKRFILYRPKLLGRVDFHDHIWRDLRDAKLDEGILMSNFSITNMAGEVLTMDSLPKVQARKVYAYAQQMEEFVHEERRIRDMEEKRAAAGGISIAGMGGMSAPAAQTAPPPKEDPVQVLGKLKQLLDAGLITQQEYDTKKNDILSRM
jgi:Bacterial PH domain/Short C-terminal domain